MAQLLPLDRCRRASRRPRTTATWRAVVPGPLPSGGPLPLSASIWRAVAPIRFHLAGRCPCPLPSGGLLPLSRHPPLQNYRVCCSSWAKPRVADERETKLPAVLQRPIARLLDESRLDCSKLDGFARRAPINRVRAPEAARRPPKRPPARPRRTCIKPRKRGRNSPINSVKRTFGGKEGCQAHAGREGLPSACGPGRAAKRAGREERRKRLQPGAGDAFATSWRQAWPWCGPRGRRPR